MSFSIVHNNIVDMHVDAIVNSANPHATIGRGVDEAIHAAAGPQLLEARKRIGDIAVGHVAVTEAFDLPARIVVHTIGPLWQGGNAGEEDAVISCYTNALVAAAEARCASIAFPLISTGTYGFPKDLALRAATRAIKTYLRDHDMEVYLVVYDDESFELSENLVGSVTDYIGRNLISSTCPVCGLTTSTGARFCPNCGTSLATTANERVGRFAPAEPRANLCGALPASAPQHTPSAAYAPKAARGDQRPHPLKHLGESIGRIVRRDQASEYFESPEIGALPEENYADELEFDAAAPFEEKGSFTPTAAPENIVASMGAPSALRSIEDVVNQVDESFSEALLRLIDERGLDDPTVYKRANIDRKLFSKIRSNPAYQPKKTTALALAIALELSLDETLDLIGRAGYTLSHASKADLIVEYFIEQNCFDLFLINETLFAFDQPLIGR